VLSIFINQSRHLGPNVFDKVQVWRFSWPFDVRTFCIVGKKVVNLFGCMDSTVVLLPNEFFVFKLTLTPRYDRRFEIINIFMAVITSIDNLERNKVI